MRTVRRPHYERKHFHCAAALLVTVCLALTTCGKDSPTRPSAPEPPATPPPAPPPAATVTTRIEISPATVLLNSVGQTAPLTARVLDQNNAVITGAAVVWSSSDTGVATVSAQGLVTAVANGTALITARSGNTSATAVITVAVTDDRIDREALNAFYLATNGPGWTNRNNWMSDKPLEEWHGVSTDSQGRVIRLVLVENNLRGSLVPDLGRLHKLTSLNLYRNQLSGAIPASLGGLRNLRELVLASNTLSGSIPPALGDLISLQSLNLGNNFLTGPIPPEIDGLKNLSQLFLWNNQLTGPIPPTLGKLERLKDLALALNQLTGPIPPTLGNLASLTSLNLRINQLSGPIPPELGNLKNLKYLDFVLNYDLTGPLPSTIVQINLEGLYLSSTDLCVPNTSAHLAWLGRIQSKEGTAYCGQGALAALYNATDGAAWTNDENWLSEAPLSEWYGVTVGAEGRVKALNLAGNNMTGVLPAALGDLAHLESLDFSSNANLSGPLPLTLIVLTDLERLRLDGTRLCASSDPLLQEWLDRISDRSVSDCGERRRDYYALAALYQSAGGPNWTNRANWMSDAPLGSWYGVSADTQGRVTEIHLPANNLGGSIPSEIGQLDKLTLLDLFRNQLSGKLPVELGELGNLTRLKLESNQLSGNIPSELGQLHLLTYLNLKWNSLDGVIPAELGQLARLTHLNLYGNKLVGEIPIELAQLPDLTELWLGDNRLTGSIPSDLGRLQKLTKLYLGSNWLRGSIPTELGQLHQLSILTLSRNGLTGSIPAELGQLQNLTSLILRINQLTGNIPAELGQLNELEWLYLSHNQLTGTIPIELGQLQLLERLHLHNNQLTGTIPAELEQLGELVHLYLNHNQLTGGIPAELGQLQSLTQLRLSFNSLTGNVPRALGDLANLKELSLINNIQMAGTLPLELTSLNLDELLLDGTRLCAPPDAGFRDWLRTIPNYRLDECESTASGSAAYLTQAIQSLTHPVPLVAGEDALLRVFLVSEQGNDAAFPPVRATLYRDGASVYTTDLPGTGTDIPLQLDEGDLASSANTLVPGSVIAPGLEMVIEIDPDRVSDPIAGIPGRLPEDGRTPIEVADVPPFDLTLVPFLWTEAPDRSVLTETEHLTAESELFRLTRGILPVREFSLSVREPVWTSVDPTANASEILGETAAIRTMDGAVGHYMGIIRGGGVAYSPGFVSISALGQDLIAHELGHNMSLGHAPCGTPGDPAFPNPDGSIGSWGYDILNGELVTPDTPDVMGYCRPDWISDYHFTKALRYRVSQEQQDRQATAYAPPTRGLLLWGGVTEDGELVLEPAFAVDASASPPRLDGPYRIVGEDEGGSALFNLRFGMAEIDHIEGGSFAFVIPIRTDWPGRMARVTLSGPEGVATLSDMDGRSAALLLDSVDGKVRGILRDWPEPDATLQSARRILPEPGLEVVISPGLPISSDWER